MENITIDLEGISFNTPILGIGLSAQDTNYWRAFMNAALNFQFTYAMDS